uniref:Uncharacterized protein n=1 Tax=Nelumbo nucifera TaxID=4432 RepID=A0A822XKZ2_NELNU|nr:TPA_asm: hypothetical protein HUJ06_022410 [Nelumbo nucifera]
MGSSIVLSPTFRCNLNDRELDNLGLLLEIFHNFDFDPKASDGRIWIGDNSGCFSYKPGYKALTGPPAQPTPRASIMWGFVPTRYQGRTFFLCACGEFLLFV